MEKFSVLELNFPRQTRIFRIELYTMNRVLFLVLLGVGWISSDEFDYEADSLVHDWAMAVVNYFSDVDCTQQRLFTDETCRSVQTRYSLHFRVYAAGPKLGKKFCPIFPNGDLPYNKTFHDAVLVLDPYPTVRFGHPILAFNVDIMNSTSGCDEEAILGMLIFVKICVKSRQILEKVTLDEILKKYQQNFKEK